MSATPDPRILDKKKKTKDKPEETFIVYRQPVIDENGVQSYKEHGPIRTQDWPAYEKEHGL